MDVRCADLLILLMACRSTESKPPPAAQQPAGSQAVAASHKPPDEMDERMRHCPLALDGATSNLEDIDGGVRFTIKPREADVEEARRRAHHIVDFAAKRTREGHGSFDGKGGGRMKNCPVVTDGVAIVARDVPGGAQLDITSTTNQRAELRTETRMRASKFPFVGATIEIARAR